MWALILSQTETGSDWLASLGPFLPFGVLAVGIILDQRSTIKELRGRDQALNEHLVETAERTARLLTEATAALAENTRALAVTQGDERRSERERWRTQEER